MPPWDGVCWYLRTWREDGALDPLYDDLQGDLRQAEATVGGDRRRPVGEDDRKEEPRCYDGGEGLTGRKGHLLVDTLGLLFVVAAHAADIQDYFGLKLVFGAVGGRFSRLRLVCADEMHWRMADWVARFRSSRAIRREAARRPQPGSKVIKRR